MSRVDVIRAWKDATFRRSLSTEQLKGLPANPAGTVELTEAEAETVNGKLALAGCSSCHGSRGCNLRLR